MAMRDADCEYRSLVDVRVRGRVAIRSATGRRGTGAPTAKWYCSAYYGGKVLFEVFFVAGYGDAVYAVGGQRGRQAVDFRLDVTVYEVVALGYEAYVFAVLFYEASGLDGGGSASHFGRGLTATALIGCGLRAAVDNRFQEVEHALRYGGKPCRVCA